jgi:hypothetical protein
VDLSDRSSSTESILEALAALIKSDPGELVMMRTAVFTGYVVAVTITSQGDQVNAPAFLAASAQGTVVDFALALSRARIPASVCDDWTPEPPDKFGIQWGWASRRTHVGLANNGGTVGMSAVLSQFQGAHANYEVLDADGIVRVRPSHRCSCERLLAMPVRSFHARGILHDVFNAVERVIDPSVPVRHGLMGSIAGAEPVDDFMPIVDVRRSSGSVRDLLDQIVVQTPGTVWIMLHDQTHGTCRLGYARVGAFLEGTQPLR